MDVLLERAQQLVQMKRFKEAEKELRLLLTQQPEQPEALALYAICQAEQGQLDEALKTIKNAIGTNPANDYLLYLHALFLFRLDKLKEAEQSIRSAISIHPRNPDYFGLLAAIKCDQKEFLKGLEYANEGLAIDPDNLQCLNMRAHALFKLDKKDEAYETIQEALQHDPENDVTHANLGWGLLERGDHKKALTHFREALKLNPNSDSAKAGLIQGLKARYVFYRWFLRYAFFVTNLKGKYQWALIIGLYIGIQIINKIADSDPELATILKPIVYVYIAFALSTWIVTPLTNLFLRLNVYGRFALSRDQIQASNFVGVAFFVAVAAIIGYLINRSDVLLSTAIVGASLMIPFSSMFGHERPSTRKLFIGLAFFLAFLGILHIIEVATSGTSGLLSIYAIGVLAYGFAANMVKIKS